jgi:predicted DNA-binding transcriptional regulator YafY
MDRLQRIYRLHQIISAHRLPVSHSLLEEKIECSRATVSRIIQELREYFNAPLEYDRERNGYYYALKPGETFELPGVWFSASELYALLTAQQLLEQAQPGLFEFQIKPLKQRIEKLLAAQHGNGNEIASRVRILRMAGRNVQPENFKTVAGALLQRRCLTISYHGRGNDQTSQREISPQRLTHYRDNWYLDAFCHVRKDLRSFAVERISDAKMLKSKCHDLPEKQLDVHFASAYGIFAGLPQQQAVLRFTAERARWVADEQWHPEQQGKFLEDGGYELQLPYSDSRELVMDILKHGAEVEVISPDALRQEVVQHLRTALARYR